MLFPKLGRRTIWPPSPLSDIDEVQEHNFTLSSHVKNPLPVKIIQAATMCLSNHILQKTFFVYKHNVKETRLAWKLQNWNCHYLKIIFSSPSWKNVHRDHRFSKTVSCWVFLFSVSHQLVYGLLKTWTFPNPFVPCWESSWTKVDLKHLMFYF